MEQPIISGVTHDTSEAKVTIFRVPDRPGVSPPSCSGRSGRRQRQRRHDRAERVDRRPHRHLLHRSARRARPHDEIVDKVVVEIDAGGSNFDAAIGRVSLVGAGMKTNPGVAAQMFETLAAENVNIEMISTSTIRISCVVHEDDVERAVRALHASFDLGS